MRLKAAALATMSVLLLAGCGGGNDAGTPAGDGKTSASPLFPDAFKGVCAGAGVSDATAFDEQSPGHKALLFQTYEDDLQDQSHALPPAWTVTFSPNANALTAIDLVVCAQRTADKVAKTCDGYEDDGKATGNKVRWHTATYDVSVREARSGKELDKSVIEATDETCPMIASFDGKNQTIDMYDSLPDTAIADVLKPYMEQK